MANNVKKQDGWAMRLLMAVCEKMLNWVLSHELDASPHESLMFVNYHSVGWEGAFVHSMARIKQIPDKEA